jgi:hypothetical protein
MAGSVATPEQGLRAFAGDGGDHDLRCDESAYAAAIGARGVKILYRADARDSPFTKLALEGKFCELRLYDVLRSSHPATATSSSELDEVSASAS